MFKLRVLSRSGPKPGSGVHLSPKYSLFNCVNAECVAVPRLESANGAEPQGVLSIARLGYDSHQVGKLSYSTTEVDCYLISGGSFLTVSIKGIVHCFESIVWALDLAIAVLLYTAETT